MKRHTRDNLIAAIEEVAADLERATTDAEEMTADAPAIAQHAMMTGVLGERCRFSAVRLRAVVDVYLRGKR